MDLQLQKDEVPTLVDFSLKKIAISIWNSSQIRMEVYRNCNDLLKCQYLVKKKVHQLVLPEKLKSELILCARHIGYQITKWMYYQHSLSVKWVASFYHRVCWTVAGTVDYLATARLMATNRSLSINFRYSLSCLFSQEDLIESIWNEMDENSREHRLSSADMDSYEEPLVSFWTLNKFGDLSKIDDYIAGNYPGVGPFVFAFYRAANTHNEISMEYFWQKMTLDQRAEALDKAAIGLRPNFSDTISMPFLVFKLDQQRQLQLFQSHPRDVLIGILDFGHLELFEKVPKMTWKLLDERDFVGTFSHLSQSIGRGCYSLMFKFWNEASKINHEYIWKVRYSWYILGDLFHTLFLFDDQDAIKTLLQDATVEQIGKKFHPTLILEICGDLIDLGNWKMLKFFGENFIVSKKAMDDLRNGLTGEWYKLVPLRYSFYNAANLKEWKFNVEAKFFDYVSTLLEITIRPVRYEFPNDSYY